MEEDYSKLCTNEYDFFTDKYKNSDNLIIIKMPLQKFLCLTRYEFDNFVNNEKPFVIYSEDGKIVNERRLSGDCFYKLNYFSYWVDRSLRDLWLEKKNTMELVENNELKNLTLFSNGHTIFVNKLYSVIPIKRGDLFNPKKESNNSDKFNDSPIIDEVEETKQIVNTEEDITKNNILLNIKSPIKLIRMSPNGENILCCQKNYVTIWDSKTLEYKFSLEKYMKNPLYSAWSSDSKYILTCDSNEIFLWDLDNNKKPKFSRKINYEISQIIFTDKIIIYGEELVGTLVLNFNFNIIFESPEIVCFSDDMKLTATIHENKKKIKVELVESKKEIYLKTGKFFDYTDLIFIDNKKLLCVCQKRINEFSVERGLVLWDIFEKTVSNIANIKNVNYIIKKINKHKVLILCEGKFYIVLDTSTFESNKLDISKTFDFSYDMKKMVYVENNNKIIIDNI